MNMVCLLGRLTKDPEVKYTTTNNNLVCTFCLAVGRKFAKENEQKADFINIVAWGKLGEFCSKYFVKGQQVAVKGRINTRDYTDKDGKKVYVTEVIAEEAHFAESKKQDDFTKQDGGFTTMEDDGSSLPF